MQQRSEYSSYVLDNNNVTTTKLCEFYSAGPSLSNTFDQVDPALNNNSTALRSGADFRRRKNWSERILVEVTGLLHVLSPTGKILYCSESTHELTGYRPHELVGQALMDFLHVDDMDVFIRDFQMSFHTRSQIKTHYRFRKKDDHYVIFEVVGQPKSDVPGQLPQSFFGIAQPIPTKSGVMMDTFLEMKAENNWLKKRIDELSSTSTHSSISPNSNYHDNHENTIEINDTNRDNEKEYMALNSQASSNNKPQQQEASDRKDKWERRKHKDVDEYVCADCGTTCSPEWRKGPHGPKTLCNACGLRWAKKKKQKNRFEW